MTTLRRELRTKFEEILAAYSDRLTLPEREPLAELLADAALSVSGIANTERKQAIAKASPEWAMLAGVDITPEMADEWKAKTDSQVEFETALGISNPLHWTKDKDWERFSQWVVARHLEDKDCFKKFQAWRMTPFVKGAIANTRLRGFINEFYDSWDMFKMADKTKPSDNGRSINTLTRNLQND